MPPRMAASRAKTEIKKVVKEPVKRSTRVAKNKRELSEDEPVAEVKKKKITDKVPLAAKTTTATNTKSKTTKTTKRKPAVSIEDENAKQSQATISKPTTTKRIRLEASKNNKSKANKDVNDNEVFDEDVEQEIENNEEPENVDDIISQDSAPTKRGNRARIKRNVKSSEIEEDETDKPDDEPTEDKPAIAKKSRGRPKKAATISTEDEIVDEPANKKRAGRSKKQQSVDDAKEEKEAAKNIPTRGASKKPRATSKKTDDQDIEEQVVSKKGRTKLTKKQSENENASQSKVSSPPPKVSSRARKTNLNKQESKDIEEAESQEQLQDSEVNAKKSSPQKSESIEQKDRKKKDASKTEVQIESQSQPEPAPTRRGRRPAKNLQEILKNEDSKNDETSVSETQSQPTTTEQPVIANKRSIRPSRKVIDNDEAIVHSQPAVSNVEPVQKKIRGRAKKTTEQKNVVPETHHSSNNDQDDDIESEQELVIDLPDEPRKKQQRVTKKLDTVSPKDADKKASDNQSALELPSANEEQNEKKSPSNSSKNKRKAQQVPMKASSDDKSIGEQEKMNQVSKMSKKNDENAQISTLEPQQKSLESSVEEKSQKLDLHKPSRSPISKSISTKDSQNNDDEDDSEDLLKQNTINDVMEDMKSMVEQSIHREESSCVYFDRSILEDSSSLNENDGEVISAKELEEDFAEQPNTSNSSSDDFKLTYESITLKTNCNVTQKTNELTSPLSFTANEHDMSAAKRIKLFDISDKLVRPALRNGTITAFGDNETGELGIGKVTNGKSQPTKIEANDEFCYVNTLSQHSVCINSQGQLYTFGNNDECALGRSTVLSVDQVRNSDEHDSLSLNQTSKTEDELQDEQNDLQRLQEKLESTPAPCNLNPQFKVFKATCGDSHTASLLSNGTVYYWGNFRDQNGKIGLSVSKHDATLEPEQIDPALEIIDIASGANFLLLLDSTGTVYSLGINDVGQLGRLSKHQCKFDKRDRDLFLSPKPIEFPKDVQIDGIWAGEFNAFARSTDDRLFAWGLNNHSQLGFDQEHNESNEDQLVFRPKEISYFTKLARRIVKVSSGQHHTLVLDVRGNVFAFGRSDYGRLGLGDLLEDSQKPKMIESLKEFKVIDISCGAACSYAVTEDGKLFSWGMESKALGLGRDPGDIKEPTEIKFKTIPDFKVKQVAAGSNHCLALGQSFTKVDELNNKAVKNGVA